MSQGVTIGGCEGDVAVIGDNCYIGSNTCIVEGVQIGTNVTIRAGSIVTKDIPDNTIAYGNPCRVVSENK